MDRIGDLLAEQMTDGLDVVELLKLSTVSSAWNIKVRYILYALVVGMTHAQLQR